MSDPLKQLIGTLYFTPTRNKDNQPVSQYEGVVSGFVVRRDDGTEFTVRSEAQLPYRGNLTRDDLKRLKIGTPLESLDGTIKYTTMRVFATSGDVWVKDNETNQIGQKKFTSLRRPS